VKAKILVAVVVVALIGWGVAGSLLETTGVPMTAARRGTLRAYVEERARTSLPQTHRLAMPLDGRILPITKRPGDRVKKGEVLAELDATELRFAVQMARARVEGLEADLAVQARNELEDLSLREFDGISRSMKAIVKTAQERVRASAARREYSEWNLKAQQDAKKSGAASEQSLQQARMALAEADVGLISNKLIAEAAEFMDIALDTFPSYLKEWLILKKMRARTTEKQLAEARVVLERAERDLARVRIISPIAGVVLLRHVEDERVLPAGAPLIDVGNLGELQVTAELLSRDAVASRAGCEVEIYGESLGSETRKGIVERVEPAAVTKLSSLGVEEQRVKVRIDLDEPNAETAPIGVGFRVRVRIFTGERKDVVIIPRAALMRVRGDRWRVFVARDGRARLVDVELGLSNDREVEVRSGVRDGEMVIVAPPTSLTDGARVSEAQE